MHLLSHTLRSRASASSGLGPTLELHTSRARPGCLTPPRSHNSTAPLCQAFDHDHERLTCDLVSNQQSYSHISSPPSRDARDSLAHASLVRADAVDAGHIGHGHMTQNNLDQHIRWLLHNPLLASKASAPDYQSSTNGDPSADPLGGPPRRRDVAAQQLTPLEDRAGLAGLPGLARQGSSRTVQRLQEPPTASEPIGISDAVDRQAAVQARVARLPPQQILTPLSTSRTTQPATRQMAPKNVAGKSRHASSTLSHFLMSRLPADRHPTPSIVSDECGCLDDTGHPLSPHG